MTIRLSANSTLGQDLLNVPSESSAPLTLLMHPSATGSEEPITFAFPYNPISITYNQLADEIAQVPRPGTTPLVFFKAHRLLTVDITFTLAVPGDGLVQSVDEEISTIRAMASNSHRVIEILNYDGLLKMPLRYRNMSKETSVTGSFSNLFFAIVDFSLDSVRRNKNNEITQANCRLSLIENRNPFQNITAIPKLQKPPRLQGCPQWKVCCPKKYKENCPQKDKTPPETNFTTANKVVSADRLDESNRRAAVAAKADALMKIPNQ